MIILLAEIGWPEAFMGVGITWAIAWAATKL